MMDDDNDKDLTEEEMAKISAEVHAGCSACVNPKQVLQTNKSTRMYRIVTERCGGCANCIYDKKWWFLAQILNCLATEPANAVLITFAIPGKKSPASDLLFLGKSRYAAIRANRETGGWTIIACPQNTSSLPAGAKPITKAQAEKIASDAIWASDCQTDFVKVGMSWGIAASKRSQSS